jgi:hypothetical protein
MVAQYTNEREIFAKSHRRRIDGSVCYYLGRKENCPSDTLCTINPIRNNAALNPGPPR